MVERMTSDEDYMVKVILPDQHEDGPKLSETLGTSDTDSKTLSHFKAWANRLLAESQHSGQIDTWDAIEFITTVAKGD